MAKRTRASVERHFRAIEETDDKGRVIETKAVKRTVVVEAEPRITWKCPQCGKEHLASIGQTIKCRHDSFTRKERREAKRKFGKHNLSRAK